MTIVRRIVARHALSGRRHETCPSLPGKVAVITGAGRGIGRATALAFARHGATVVAANRRHADGESLTAEIAAAGGTAHFVATDVAAPEQIRRLMDEAVARCGRIDIVFNNAGYQEPRTPLADTPEDHFDRVFHTNVQSVWLGMKYALAHMVPAGERHHRQLRLGERAAQPQSGAVALLGVQGRRHLADALGRHGVRGEGRAHQCGRPRPHRHRHDAGLADHGHERRRRRAALRRMGRPEEVAEAVVWLASDAAAFVVGHVLCTDGGFMAL